MRAGYSFDPWRDWKEDLVPLPVFGISKPRMKIPPQFASENDILTYLGVSQKELKKIWWYRGKMYHEFNIAKGAGKVRAIYAPDARLKFLQRQLSKLLTPLYRVRHPVHGFVPDKSVKSNAESHLRKRYILNLDLENFFPSISENRVVGLLQSLGIDTRVSEIVARICCKDGCLPQGAPTSPLLSNMICFRMDRQLMGFARLSHSIFTRYADDITFSSNQPMASIFEEATPPAGRLAPERLSSDLRSILSANGFRINETKVHYADRHSRRMVTGIKVNELLNVDRRFVRNIRAALYSVEILGIDEAQKKFESLHGGTSAIDAHLKGKLSWLGFIRGQSDPVFRSLATRYNNSFSDRKIEISPTKAEMRDRAVWVIERFKNDDNDKQGSAFFLKDVGLVTAAHCVENIEEVDLFHPSKPTNVFKATPLKVDPDRDIAILSHEVPATDYFELEGSEKDIAVGESSVAVGYPDFAVGDNLNVREGKVSSMSVKSGVELIEVQQKLTQGMSGGPLLNQDDAVVGIVHKGGPDEGRDFAIKLSELSSVISAT